MADDFGFKEAPRVLLVKPFRFFADAAARAVRRVAITLPISLAAATYAASWLDQRSGAKPTLGSSLKPAARVSFQPYDFSTTACTSLRALRFLALP